MMHMYINTVADLEFVLGRFPRYQGGFQNRKWGFQAEYFVIYIVPYVYEMRDTVILCPKLTSFD